MPTTIKLRNSVTTTSAPSSLVQGEVAINITDKKVWVGNAAGTPIQLLGAGGSASFGALTCTSLTNSGLTSGRVTYASTGGLLADSANFTFNGTTVTMANDAFISGLRVGKGASGGSNNTILGEGAGAGAGSNFLTAIGYLAGAASTDATFGNTFIGRLSGTSNTSGGSNSVLGNGAFDSNTTGSNNTAIGDSALQSNTTASNNTAVGYQAGYSNTTASYNSAVGYRALFSNTTGAYNDCFGTDVGYSNTTGTNISGFGAYVLAKNTTGVANVGMGGSGTIPALYNNTTGSYNVGLGTGALFSNTTASSNTAVGYVALQKNTAAENTAVGSNCLRENISGVANNGVGYTALVSNTTGSRNNAMGYSALFSNTTGSDNVAIGHQTLVFNTTGSLNTAFGTQALAGNTTASKNTAVGYQAGYSNTTGANNSAFGQAALYTNTTGNNNLAVGGAALFGNTTGSSNVAIGTGVGGSIFATMEVNTTGSSNTAVGLGALGQNTTASNGTAIGYQALYGNTTGPNNIGIGYQVGSYVTTLTTGGQNILIGNYTRTSAATSNQQFVIGYDVAGQADNNITIGTGSGKIYNAFTVNATWTQTSDGRLKKNIQDDTLGLSFINRLRPVKYEWKASNELDKNNPYYAEENKRTTGVVMHGLIAQEVKEALDAEGVTTFAGWDEGDDGIQAISREMFITPLIKAIQELKAEVDSLKAQLNKE